MEGTINKNQNTESTDKQGLKQEKIDRIAPFRFKPGISGNPNGRPKGKTLKEFCRDYLSCMTDEERIEFLNTLTPEFIWRMAEGNPRERVEIEKEEIPNPYANLTEEEKIEELRWFVNDYDEKQKQKMEEAKKIQEIKQEEQAIKSQESNQTQESVELVNS